MKTILDRSTEWWLNESDFYGTIDKFKLAREPFNHFIAQGDKVLDIGCANGFLLYMLQQWRQDDFIPYGIDIDSSRVDIAKKLFFSSPTHFSVQNMYSFNWGTEHLDVIIAPWSLESSFPHSLKAYKKTFPFSKLLISLYDDEKENFNLMRNHTKDLFYNYEIEEIEVPNMTKIMCIGNCAA